MDRQEPALPLAAYWSHRWSDSITKATELTHTILTSFDSHITCQKEGPHRATRSLINWLEMSTKKVSSKTRYQVTERMREMPPQTWRDSVNLHTAWQRVWPAQAEPLHHCHLSRHRMTTTADEGTTEYTLYHPPSSQTTHRFITFIIRDVSDFPHLHPSGSHRSRRQPLLANQAPVGFLGCKSDQNWLQTDFEN